MKQKILVVYRTEEEKKELEEILVALVEKGFEILYTNHKATAKSLLATEKPRLAFVDAFFEPLEGKNIVWIHERKERTGGLSRPFHASKVLEICHQYLDFMHVDQSQELPM
jgi:hypothetical protein